ncbi:MAG: HAD hydrolase family protein [Oscillospiraceae bacterium]|nr:HAD hydrolase family protein [Oscillospiraceae bacterium]
MDVSKIKLIAFDLDGTLTQHKTLLSPEHRAVLDALGKKYQLLMLGAGMCYRVFNQMGRYPIDIYGNYGMQLSLYCPEKEDIEIIESVSLPCDRESIEKRVTMLREKYGFTEFAGDNVEYHASGVVTFPILGTKAKQADKLAFDPDRKKRRAIYEDVKQVFSDYGVFICGSSSFDMVPVPYNKAYALDKYCAERGIRHEEVVYVGDDYGPGGNDESVYLEDYNFIEIDNYLDFPQRVQGLL